MKPGYAALAGMLTGFLFGCAICLIQNIPLSNALFRIFILTAAGAWMGILLAWLNQLLPSKVNRPAEHTDGGA
ncbi:MAG: hypothetical protein Q9M82_01810 [Mariprofundus sp.]|nr:hypothetical protein [Mariprofundus sp.]